MDEALPEVYLARHGETEWNREGVFRGRKDFPLNETGKAQAGKTGSPFFFPALKTCISRCWAS